MSMSPDTPSRIVLCEGAHDRAFWGKLLERRFGCSGATDPAGTHSAGRAKGGYRTASDKFIRFLVKDGGPTWQDVRSELTGAATRPIEEIVLCLDLDTEDEFPDFQQSRKQRKQDMLRLGESVRLVDARPLTECWDDATLTAVFPIASQSAPTRISVALWGVSMAHQPGIPKKQTLERVACAAVAAAYPDTAEPVSLWLASRPQPPVHSKHEHKAFAASYMAGWYAKRDYQGFFQAVWEDRAIAEQLERLLKTTGTWAVMERVAA